MSCQTILQRIILFGMKLYLVILGLFSGQLKIVVYNVDIRRRRRRRRRRRKKKMKKSYIGCSVVASYQGSNDNQARRIRGYVVSVRNVVGDKKGPLLVIQTEWKGYFLTGTQTLCEKSVYRSIYLNQAEEFRVLRRPVSPVEYTGKDEPCDAVRDYARVND